MFAYIAEYRMMELLKTNIGWLKDFFTLVFTATGTTLAILTYMRARATILQPIRTEVIKRQSELLSRLLQILKEKNQSFDNGLDYVKLTKVNVLYALGDYGYIFKEQEELFKNLETEIIGWMPCGADHILRDVHLAGSIDEKELMKSVDEYKKAKYELLLQGEIEIDKIYLTKQHMEFHKLISEFAEDPFMPTSIQETLNNLSRDIQTNLRIFLKTQLEEFVLAFSKAYSETGEYPKINPDGVYNQFNHSRIHHRSAYNSLRNEIRKYLRIDEEW